MTVKRLDHAGIVVEDLASAIAFFVELGLEVEGTTTVEGAWVDQLVGLDGVNADMAMLKVPGGHGRIELSAFRSPTTTATAHREPVDTPGIPRLAFVVDDLDDVFGRLRAHGAELVGEMAQYEQFCRYGYVRGPGGAIVGLVEESSSDRQPDVRSRPVAVHRPLLAVETTPVGGCPPAADPPGAGTWRDGWRP